MCSFRAPINACTWPSPARGRCPQKQLQQQGSSAVLSALGTARGPERKGVGFSGSGPGGGATRAHVPSVHGTGTPSNACGVISPHTPMFCPREGKRLLPQDSEGTCSLRG